MSEVQVPEIKFGTDGWRAVISDTFTFKNVAIVSQAISEWINRDLAILPGKHKRVAVGFDTRFLSEEYAQTVSCVLAKNNIEVFLSERALPTPALSLGVTELNAMAGIMITASHNPGKFNGIKIKTFQGGAASKEITNSVEKYLYQTPVQTMDLEEAVRTKKVVRHNYKTAYVKFLRGYLDLKKMRNARFKVLTDAMHGSGNGLMREVLKGTKVRLSLMRDDVNPSFDGGKPEPIAEFVPELCSRVKNEKFDVGLILDGDADRIGAVAPGGEFVNPQRILGLLILHLAQDRGMNGGVVKTICGSTMLDKIAAKLKLKLHETPVGFKYISDLMVTQNILTGGEEAGGIGFKNYIPERDGSLAGLLLLEMMVYRKKNLRQLLEAMEKEFGRYYYLRSDLALKGRHFEPAKIKANKTLLGKEVVEVKDFDGVKLICSDESWLMFRPSGTEPLVRIYAEAKSLARAKQLLKLGETLI